MPRVRSPPVFVVAGFISVNSIGYLAYRSIKPDPTETAATAQDPVPSVALIRVNRAAGLQAFEEGDYDVAVEKLTEAAKLGGGGDIPELLLIPLVGPIRPADHACLCPNGHRRLDGAGQRYWLFIAARGLELRNSRPRCSATAAGAQCGATMSRANPCCRLVSEQYDAVNQLRTAGCAAP